MKYIILTLSIASCLSFLACRKTRTCACKYTDVATTVTTPRAAVQPSTSVSTETGEEKITYSKVKKDDLKRFMNCENRTETTGTSYTTVVGVPTQTTVFGFTYTTFVTHTADVVYTRKVDYSCEIE